MDDQARLHLSELVTSWSMLRRAGAAADSPEEAAAAQRATLERYAPAIHRYLLAAARDRDRAEDLFQEFALKFLQGDFHRADPQRGRFRDYLKTSLYHLIVREQTRRRPAPLTIDAPGPEESVAGSAEDEDAAFLKIWREELIRKAWGTLMDREAEDGRPLHTVLRFRADHPELDSKGLAEALSARLGRDLSAEWVRKWLHQARKRFAADLCDEVARSLGDGAPSADDLERELQVLGWLDTCRDALRDRFRR